MELYSDRERWITNKRGSDRSARRRNFLPKGFVIGGSLGQKPL